MKFMHRTIHDKTARLSSKVTEDSASFGYTREQGQKHAIENQCCPDVCCEKKL